MYICFDWASILTHLTGCYGNSVKMVVSSNVKCSVWHHINGTLLQYLPENLAWMKLSPHTLIGQWVFSSVQGLLSAPQRHMSTGALWFGASGLVLRRVVSWTNSSVCLGLLMLRHICPIFDVKVLTAGGFDSFGWNWFYCKIWQSRRPRSHLVPLEQLKRCRLLSVSTQC